MDTQRIDKWLWAARFYKTRALAVEEIHKGRVLLNGQPVKPAREIRVGDCIRLRQGEVIRTINVRGLSLQRGPAAVAQQLYEETEASRQAREAAAERRRLAAEPALSIPQGRPTKRDRRQLERVGWDARWSAGID
ncbi:MAG: RNA-binding S4 domain-containing protein [Hylemonella sp.]